MIKRVAYLSTHTCPLEQPGSGYAGGMNVYIKELGQTMAARGVEVQVFTRRADDVTPTRVEVVPGFEVIHIEAGPKERLATRDLPPLVAEFADGVVQWAYANDANYDLVHSHYWLSGWAGVLVKEALGIPLINSFHTLGRVKDANRGPDEPPESLVRIATEEGVIAMSNCVVASTSAEAEDLIDHYHADPAKLCISPPGVDHDLFTPGDSQQARRRIGLRPGPLLLFVGRIQPLKGLNVAIRAVHELAGQMEGVQLAVVGGPSGPGGVAALDDAIELVHKLDMDDAVHFFPAQDHADLPDFYRAADVLLVPSRSESFGLVAAEAQACGLPVVAARVGGLGYAVSDGESGFLVDGWDPVSYAVAAAKILYDPGLAAQLSEGASIFSARFSWPATADRLIELYTDIANHEPE